MSLIATIKARSLAARKARDSATSSALSTFIGEAEMIGKNAGREVSDAEVTALLKKFAKNAREVASIAGDYRDADRADAAWFEIELYEGFLPKQLTEEQLRTAINDVIVHISFDGDAGKPKMGDVIKALKAKYEGQYDGALASKLIKEQLQ